MVAAAFLGNCPPEHETTHQDGDYTNNALENLQYVTRGENQKRFVMRSGGYSVNLTKRVQTANGMRYCPVAESANGRVKPDVVLVNGKEERHPEGAYYLEWREGASVSAYPSARTPGRQCPPPAQGSRTQRGQQRRLCRARYWQWTRSVAAAIADFLDETNSRRSPKRLQPTRRPLNTSSNPATSSTSRNRARKDLLKFSAFLRDEKEQAPRSVYNKFENVMTFLKANGIRGLVGKNDWPRFTEEEPEIYEQEELDKLLQSVTRKNGSGTSSS